ncbi:MAG: ribbon-helix-helix domain-containing protein [Elusimicrobia bacterium]|nr:ribbon-helix-helix domain-containing protein [Elusimicrobiota bacterium]
MVRTTIYLPESLHSALKHLAVELRCPMADLLRKAVKSTYRAELGELRAAQKAWKARLKRPSKAVSARSQASMKFRETRQRRDRLKILIASE